MKKIFCFLFITALVFSVFATVAFAEDSDVQSVYDPASFETSEGLKTQNIIIYATAAFAAAIVAVLIMINFRQSK